MFSTRTRGALAAGAIAGLAAAFAPALPSDAPAPTQDLDVLTAADLGLAYAPKLVQVDAPTLEQRNELNDLGLDLMEHASHGHVEVVLSSAEEEEILREAGFEYEVEIEDLVADINTTLAEDDLWAAEVGISDMPSGRTTYRTLDDYVTDMETLEAEHPDIAKKIVIGQSVEARDLVGLEIGRDVQAPEDGRPVFLMFGVHHAREWPSAEMTMEFGFDLVQGYTDSTHDNHARIVDLLDRARVIIVPVSNPDGFHTSRTHGEIFDFSNGPAWWRKNCRYVAASPVQPEGTCLVAAAAAGQTSPIGVDLNRNYGGLWGGPGADAGFEDGDYGNRGILGQASGTYRGPAPFSEPETQAIRDLISTRQVTTLITNHTRGHLLLRPNGVAPSTITPFDGFPRGYAPDECFLREDGVDYGMQALGERMTAQNGYSNQFGWELYDTTGTTEDYSYNATGGYGYTFELMPAGGSFHPNYSVVVQEYTGTNIKSGNLRALEGTAMGQAQAMALTSAGKDDCAGDHVEHTTLGGGLRESYLIALENAADARTHSLITGTAPAGAEITVTRTGMFPTWDDEFEDTVTTTMTVTEGGTFAYHVNPSTRPILDSRRYRDAGGKIKETGRKGLDGKPFEGEYWTVSCNGGQGVDVLVDRGQSVDVGDICA